MRSLQKVGLITWRREARSHIGAFFVRKKPTMAPGGHGEVIERIRLVLDCRPTNQLHRAPPKSRLATPGALGSLNLSAEWSALGGDAGRQPLHVCGASIDLQDGYYQFEIEPLASWFSLGELFSAADAGVSEVYDEQSHSYVPVAADEHLWACFRCIPMGWSWGLFFAHSALEEAGRKALLKCGLPAVLLSDWGPCPPITTETAIIAPYVDNGNVIGGSKEIVDKVLVALIGELESVGLKCHE